MTTIYFKNQDEFRKWLEKNYKTETELLVGYYKVDSGRPSMTWSQSVDQALCFGWIDGIRRSIDKERYCIRFTPRKPTSAWDFFKSQAPSYQKMIIHWIMSARQEKTRLARLEKLIEASEKQSRLTFM